MKSAKSRPMRPLFEFGGVVGVFWGFVGFGGVEVVDLWSKV